MSLITGSAYPRKMTRTPSLWKTIDRQGLETQRLGAQGLDTQRLSGQGSETQGLGAQGLDTQSLNFQDLETQRLGVLGTGSQFGDDDQYEGVDREFSSNGLFYFCLINLKILFIRNCRNFSKRNIWCFEFGFSID